MSYAFLWRLRALASQSFLLHAIAFYIRCLGILIWMFHESIFRPVHDRSWAIINSHLLAQTVMKRSVTIKLKYLITLRVTACERTDTEGYGNKTTGDGLGHGTKSHLRVNSIQAIFGSLFLGAKSFNKYLEFSRLSSRKYSFILMTTFLENLKKVLK